MGETPKIRSNLSMYKICFHLRGKLSKILIIIMRKSIPSNEGNNSINELDE
jgi:hypothetical protein